MADLITAITPAITLAFTTVGTVAETIVSTPILLVSTGFFIVGGAIGIFGRLLSRR